MLWGLLLAASQSRFILRKKNMALNRISGLDLWTQWGEAIILLNRAKSTFLSTCVHSLTCKHFPESFGYLRNMASLHDTFQETESSSLLNDHCGNFANISLIITYVYLKSDNILKRVLHELWEKGESNMKENLVDASSPYFWASQENERWCGGGTEYDVRRASGKFKKKHPSVFCKVTF